MKTSNYKPLMIAALLIGTALSLVLGAPLMAATGLAVGAGYAAPALRTLMPTTPNGAMALNLGNILWGDGDDNMGGIRTMAYYCLHSEIQRGGHAAPVARVSATTLEELGTIAADHTFKSGKGWKRLYNTEDSGMVESTMQGEKDGKSWINKAKFFHPGNKSKVLGWMRWIQNAGTYWIGVDAEGSQRMVGSEHYPAKLDTSTITTTETAAGRKGCTFEVTCSSPFPAPIVTATIDIEDDDSSY